MPTKPPAHPQPLDIDPQVCYKPTYFIMDRVQKMFSAHAHWLTIFSLCLLALGVVYIFSIVAAARRKKSPLEKLDWLFIAMWTLASILWVHYLVFIDTVPLPIHLRANPNWVHLISDDCVLNEASGLPEYHLEGIQAQARGSFHLICYPEELTTESLPSISVIDETRRTNIAVDVPFPATFSIRRSLATETAFTYLDCLSYSGGSLLLAPLSNPPTVTDNTLHKAPSLDQMCSFSLPVPKNYGLYLKFLETSVQSEPDNTVLKEFVINSPINVDAGAPGQKLSIKTARTMILNCFENVTGPQKRPIMTLAVTNILIREKAMTLNLGNMTRSGDYSIYIPAPDHVFSLSLTNATPVPFDFAITPEATDSNADMNGWISVSGGARSIYLNGPSCFLSIGDNKRTLDMTDRVQIVGNLAIRLDFNPPSLPALTLDGDASSCQVNGAEMVPTRWRQISSDVRAAIVGGIIGFALSLLTNLAASRFAPPKT